MERLSYSARVAQLAQEDPGRVAIVHVRPDGTERELDRLGYLRWSTALGHRLAARGVGAESLVALALPNGLEHYAATAATWALGACLLALSPAMPKAEREALLALAAPDLVIADWPGADLSSRDVLDARGDADVPPLPDRTARPARASATGGSTGRPKLIRLPDAMDGVPGDLGPAAHLAGLRSGMTHLVLGPLYHGLPHAWSHFGLFQDHAVVVMERFDPALAVDLIERHRVSFLQAVPTHLGRIAKLPGIPGRDLSSIEAVFHTGGACAPWVKVAWIDLVGAERIYEGYGMTEAIGLAGIRGDEWLDHPGSVGRPIGCDVRILDEAGAEVPAGTVGRIFMRPAGGARHTYVGAEATPATPDGFHSVGDLGHLDDDGYLYIADRRMDMVVTGGVNVFPAEVEAVLSEHPDVHDVAVIGLPDDDLGRRVHALVQPRQGASLTDEELLAFCAERLARAKLPRSIELVSDLPRDDAGKIRRSGLLR